MIDRRMLAALLALCVSLAFADQSAPDIARCQFCHGHNGIAQSPIWPSLAGLNRDYLERRMLNYRAGMNSSPDAQQMRYILNRYTEAELENVATYFAKLLPPQPAGPGSRGGAKIYREGLPDRVAPCLSCHGRNGEGIGSLKAPRLAGQSSAYLLKQLNAYADGARPDNLSGMTQLAQELSPEQRRDLSIYLQSFQPEPESENSDES